jgi:hypothetical protein
MNIMDTQLAKEVNKLLASQWFGKNVHELMRGMNISSLNQSLIESSHKRDDNPIL